MLVCWLKVDSFLLIGTRHGTAYPPSLTRELPVLGVRLSAVLNKLGWRLPHSFSQDHFKPIGHVQFVEIPEDAQGRSKGHGTVRFANEQDAARAIAQLNNSELGGRPIFVREDQQV